MIRCEVIENFNLKEFDKLKIIERKGQDTKGQLTKGDIFECDEEMAKYLTGNNALNKTVVKVIEVKPEKFTAEKVIESAKDDKEFVEPTKPKKKKKNKK